jgi:hypothetical protein
MAKGKSYIEGPRWARLQSFLKKLAFDHGLEITLDVEKGLIFETVFFEVEGDADKIIAFGNSFVKAAEGYNGGY